MPFDTSLLSGHFHINCIVTYPQLKEKELVEYDGYSVNLPLLIYLVLLRASIAGPALKHFQGL